MPRLGLGVGRGRPIGLLPRVAPPPLPTGFAANGASNAALKAMLARVRGGTGRGRIVMKGDSTTVGQGGGSDADANRLTGARAHRVPAMLAAALGDRGYPALDAAVTGDGGLASYELVSLSQYDPRIAYGDPGWSAFGGQTFAGGDLLRVEPDGTYRTMRFAPDTACDTFEIVYYNADAATLDLTIDGAAPADGPASVAIAGGSGFSLATVRADGAGHHTLGLGSAANVAVQTLMPFASARPAIDIVVHASLGATSADQAARGNGWQNDDALAFAAPDCTIVNLGLNDMAQGLSVDDYAANLRTIVATAQRSGDVLVVDPYPAAPAFAPLETQIAFRDMAAAVAQDTGVAFLSLFDHFGGYSNAFGKRLADGLVHGDAGLYTEVGEIYAHCLLAMVG